MKQPKYHNKGGKAMTDDYNSLKDTAESLDAARKAIRMEKIKSGEIIPWKRKEVIGDIVLYQGDCLEVMAALEPVDSLVTDPPYGMSFQSNHRKDKHRPIANDIGDKMLKFACGIPVIHSKYIWMRWDNLASLPKPKSLVTWVKDNWSMGDLKHEHARQTEVAAFYPGPDHYFPNGRPQDVIYAPRTGNNFHPTEKPIDLMMKNIKWTIGTVTDCYMGSGTTLVACAKMGRKGIGIELDPDYFEIACERVRKAYEQPDFFVSQPKEPEAVQASIFDGEAAE